LKLREVKRIVNYKLVDQGIVIDRALWPDQVDTLALAIVEKIKATVEDGKKVYVFGARQYRIKEESFKCLSERGNGRRLITDKNGDMVTVTEMEETYGWKLVKDLYTSTSPFNVNEVEKRVHQHLYEDERSIWIRNGAGGVKMGKDNKMLMFSLSIIHGSRGDLRFTAKHPRKL